MTPEQSRTIYDWALIQEYAKGKVSAEMMVEVGKMNDALAKICCVPDRGFIYPSPCTNPPPMPDGMPEEILRFAKASSDPGCGHCWLSSKIGGTHPECQAKIKEWFDAREALITFGLKLDRSALAAMR